MSVKDFVRAVRKRLNLTQKEFADRLGVHRGTVGYWEIGHQVPDSQHITSMLSFLGLTIDDCLELPPEPSSLDEEESLVRVLRELYRRGGGPGAQLVRDWGVLAKSFLKGLHRDSPKPRNIKRRRSEKVRK